MDSRVKGTRTLARRWPLPRTRPRFSRRPAIGYYGDTDDQRITEESSAADFAALVTIEGRRRPPIATPALAWPTCAPASCSTLRRAKEQLPFFKLGIGGRIGDGTQWFSWIRSTMRSAPSSTCSRTTSPAQ